MTHQTVRDWDAELVPTQAGRTEAPTVTCPVEVVMSVLSPKWCTLIVRELLHEPLGYRALSSRLPMLSDKVLSDRLAHLTRSEIVERHRTSAFPPRVSYRLTARGQALRPVLVELYRAGQAILERA